MAMLTIPLVFVDLASDRVSVQENRMLAQSPPLADIRNHPATFIRGFDAWLKDSTGFRGQLLALYDALSRNRRLNGVWYTDGQYIYLIGEEGHVYFAGEGGILIRKFQGKQFLTNDQLTNMAVKLDEVNTYLDNKGIPLIVMFCTDKETIYPEFYPKSIKRGEEPIQLDIITRYLLEHVGVDLFNIKQALLVEKNNYLLYPLVDIRSFDSGDFAHYNEIGAFFAYRELMRHINVYFPEIIPYELSDIDISYDRIGIPDVSIRAGTSYIKLDPSFFDDVNVLRPYTWENVAYENEEFDLPVILLLRDSYAYTGPDRTRFLANYLPQHFGRAILIHYINIEHFEKYIEKYKPDIVVFESAERELQRFANCVEGIPKL
ncbi:MAG: hypothetical protein LBQ94_06735 [Treponema sp.]|jgi:hypothetical protein|nr:hypothetical protein [Treponema sp.]